MRERIGRETVGHLTGTPTSTPPFLRSMDLKSSDSSFPTGRGSRTQSSLTRHVGHEFQVLFQKATRYFFLKVGIGWLLYTVVPLDTIEVVIVKNFNLR